MKNLVAYTFAVLCLLLSPGIQAGETPVHVHVLNNNSGLSNSAVTSIFQDRQGVLWVGTWDGLNRYDGHSVTQYLHSNADTTSLSHQVIRTISEDDAGRLWVATDYGINRLDKATGKFTQYFLDYKPRYIHREKLFSCRASAAGTVVASFHAGGLYRFDKAAGKFAPVEIKGYNRQPGIVSMVFDRNNELWICTRFGTVVRATVGDEGAASFGCEIALPHHRHTDLLYDGTRFLWLSDEGDLFRIDTEKEKPELEATGMRIDGRLTSVRDLDGVLAVGTTTGMFVENGNGFIAAREIDVPVLAIFKGTQDILWIGTDGDGVYSRYRRPSFIRNTPFPGMSSGNRTPVRAIAEADDGSLWIGRKGGGLVRFPDKDNPQFANASYYNVGSGLTENAVLSLSKGRGRIWVGTDGSGLQYVDMATGKLQHLELPDVPESRAMQSVYSIVETAEGELYAGTAANGLLRVTFDSKGHATDIRNFRHSDSDHSSIGSDIVYSLADDGDALWVATRGGGLSLMDKKSGTFTTFKTDPPEGAALCSNDVVSLLKDSRNRVWAGTTSGLCMLEHPTGRDVKIRIFDKSCGLPNENIHAIEEDSQGKIWVSTSFGIAKINPDDGHATAYYYEDGLQGNEFSDGASFASSGGEVLYFGGVNGMNTVYPAMISGKNFMPNLVVSSVELDNSRYTMEENRIDTDYTTSSINIGFSVTDFLDNKKCRLSYRLEPVAWWKAGKGEWVDLGNIRNVLLSQLAPGEYRLSVRMHNAANEAAMPQEYLIAVAGPVWASWWMICLYILAGVWYIRKVFKVKRGRLTMRHELELERQEQLNKEEVHQAKLSFFTNIAHEFSNSITLIYGAASQMIDHGVPDNHARKQLLAIQSNAERMREQIQELMEFRKAETGYLMPKFTDTDIAELVQRTADNFIDATESKEIDFRLNMAPEASHWVVDKNMLEKIVFNLMSNALKYTPHGGTVEFSTRLSDNGALTLCCTNSGPGIPPEDLENVFNRFTILDKFEHKLAQGQYSRNGIGLALCKDLTKLMGGTISVASEVDHFTTFTVSIPEHDVSTADEKECGQAPAAPLPAQDDRTPRRLFEPHRPTILIVDDQKDIRELIADVLGGSYDLKTASNGKEALEIVSHSLPSLIISDIIMPEMNGIEFIKVLKADERTKFIPVIMLSSGTDIESSIDVLKTGANMFVGKPFHPHYLKVAVENTLNNHSMMKRFSESPTAYKEKYNDAMVSAEDKAFVDATIDVLSKHYGEDDYTQEHLAADMALSKIQLYRRLKRITGTTPNDFIRSYRLTQVERMLLHTDKTIQEIMGECGFHNKAYFYRVFQKTYGCSPREFRINNAGGAG